MLITIPTRPPSPPASTPTLNPTFTTLLCPPSQRAVDSCPVDCIHAVPRDDLAALEFLMQPRERASKGLFGGGWEKLERGSVFQAAQTFKKRLQKQQAEGGGSRTSRGELEGWPSFYFFYFFFK